MGTACSRLRRHTALRSPELIAITWTSFDADVGMTRPTWADLIAMRRCD
jgi:hypothetical protein